MKTDDPHLVQLDSFEARLSEGLDGIASATPIRTPGEFDPDMGPFVFDGTSRRRVNPALTAAAVAAVTVAGLVVIGSRNDERVPSSQPPQAEPSANFNSTPAVDDAAPSEAAFVFKTPTVVLEAETLQVITSAGTFSPTAEVVVEGDPGMPDEYTTLELTWNDGAEQRLFIYFTSDGSTWWANEIRTYDGTDRNEWIEPTATGRFFESPLGTAYTGQIDLANLRVTGLKLQAFVRPEACDARVAPVALIADHPSIDGVTSLGYGASFQVYDTAACTPLPIDNYSFEYTIDDPTVAVITDSGQRERVENPPTATTVPGIAATPETPGRREFNEIKTRVGLHFLGAGSTTLHVTARDTTGMIIGPVDVPVTVREMGTESLTVDTTLGESSP